MQGVNTAYFYSLSMASLAPAPQRQEAAVGPKPNLQKAWGALHFHRREAQEPMNMAQQQF